MGFHDCIDSKILHDSIYYRDAQCKGEAVTVAQGRDLCEAILAVHSVFFSAVDRSRNAAQAYSGHESLAKEDAWPSWTGIQGFRGTAFVKGLGVALSARHPIPCASALQGGYFGKRCI